MSAVRGSLRPPPTPAYLPQWKSTQVVGEGRNQDPELESDFITALEFDETGRYLAIGDRSGKIQVLESKKEKASTPSGKAGAKKGTSSDAEYQPLAEFQSHEPEFDYLKSLEIEEKINKIRWMKRTSGSHMMLSTNDKTIKLWKLSERRTPTVSNANTDSAAAGVRRGGVLKFPKRQMGEKGPVAMPRKVYQNAHAYHINSISCNSDGETFISADDLRINLWNAEVSDKTFTVVDIKPASMEELTEVITAAEFHPRNCHHFAYSNSRGSIKLCDLRASSLCDDHAKSFEEEEDPASRTFFSEIISSISDIKFTEDGRYLIARDYMTVKVWDLHMESRPVKTLNIHEHLRAKLCDLYEKDFIFDKFECSLKQGGKQLVTGSYNHQFHVLDWASGTDMAMEATKNASKKKAPQFKRLSLGRGRQTGAKDPPPPSINTDLDTIDFMKRVLHCAFHPHDNTVAVGASGAVYLYTG
uniref:Serine/threonine-protein phosphatase 2A 55 kDa regulatory subunit B n=1 Tax=Palpitomonas bilix TaxID=652834 RepID=A0A7S3D003_9EUKA|mmetsp:Transcript_16408/g.41636  ORF Transcript_16408/g.41636 Transcript_16408/m.41636 type:complete len:471 (+) Transcript_16408:142-1554(+)|eukprot:CAMPEP_0113871860 /NCGR_PEP_ID=MMETSP0780_2-20120614/2880_1 /TAXON_ID=652834 /ORGANISM="Palpitomonas bilix" /LENGTH=470 /DNA_ID=CAMNT_0000857303 /DNA_START=121 /DNA_END=1533 /DNA_ORIENTATION=- /assembly_acc=CAM_ASM_000599